MVDVKISGLPAAAALTGNESVPAVQGGSSVKVLVSAIRAGLAADGSVVHNFGDEGIGGIKSFAARPVFSSGAMFPADQTVSWATGARVHATFRGALISSVDHGIFGAGSTATPGRLSFRPKGNSDSTDQVTIEPDGSMVWFGGAAAKAATRASLGAVGRTGNEDVSGEKNFTSPSKWTLGTSGIVQFSTPAGVPGITGRGGDPAGGVESTYRTDLRFGPGFFQLITNIAPSSAAGTKGFQIDNNFFPVESNTMSCGKPTNVWANVYTQNAPITGSDKRKKKNLRHMSDIEEAAFLEIAELESVWEWNVGDRIHGGPTVQDAHDVMLDHGLDPWAYSCFCHDSWPAKEAVWREWPAREEAWEEWPAQDAVYDVVQATYDDDGQVLTPEIHIMVSPAVEAGRRLISEAVEAGRELVEPAVEAGESFSFRVGELHAWMLAAMARRDRREREAAELRLASIEQRLAVLETGK